MKVYVDKLPKSCRDCPCMESDGYGFYTCLLYYKKHEMLLDCEDYKDSRPNECLLQSLSDYTKQVRKEVCEEIVELAKNEFEFLICDECYNTVDKDVYISSVALTEILDQIQGEAK